ncbi:MAG: succinylglutamate desuccinylase/aspartoacylase family protein [Halanaeroarchaeum sp.]
MTDPASPLASFADPGTVSHFRYEIGETYLGDPVEIPVSIVEGSDDGPTGFVTAAVHGDELNGVKVAQRVAATVDPEALHGRLVVVHVVNVPGFLAQQRYIPIYDQDMNRSFPGSPTSNTAERMAHEIYDTFVAHADFGLDFHTSTRNRTTMYHVRADVTDDDVDALARSFGANIILQGAGEDGSLRKVATDAGIPTITVEMGRAHRFQRPLIERAVDGVRSVLAERGMLPEETVSWPGWYKVMSADNERRWIRAPVGGLVDMEWGPTPLVHEDEPICTITDHFGREEHVVRAPFTGIIVGILENPVALPGHPLGHLVRLDPGTRDEIEAEIERGEFDGYRSYGFQWSGTEDD